MLLKFLFRGTAKVRLKMKNIPFNENFDDAAPFAWKHTLSTLFGHGCVAQSRWQVIDPRESTPWWIEIIDCYGQVDKTLDSHLRGPFWILSFSYCHGSSKFFSSLITVIVHRRAILQHYVRTSSIKYDQNDELASTCTSLICYWWPIVQL